MVRVVVRSLALAAILSSISGSPGLAQGRGDTILEIDTENVVSYNSDVFDPSRFATDPGPTTLVATARNFGFVLAVGDIVAVNGKPARGTLVVRQQGINLSPTPNPGQAQADIVRTGVSDYLLEIQQAEGTPVGSIHTLGLSGGSAPLGAPLGNGNLTVAGGTGAFLGARGQMATSLTTPPLPPRAASVTEDPSMRRLNGGGKVRFLVQLIPMIRPEIVVDRNGPAIFHADFSPVSARWPARAGEVLIVKATSSGPTVNPGQPFPRDSWQEVNSLIAVLVNGREAEVVNKLGWPGLVNTYRVDFRVPDDISSGIMEVQLSVAWVAGAEVSIPVQ